MTLTNDEGAIALWMASNRSVWVGAGKTETNRSEPGGPSVAEVADEILEGLNEVQSLSRCFRAGDRDAGQVRAQWTARPSQLSRFDIDRIPTCTSDPVQASLATRVSMSITAGGTGTT